MKNKFRDLTDLQEDARISQIGEAAMVASHKGVGICIDDEPDKIARYKLKLAERFPALEIFSEGRASKGVYAMCVRRRIGDN